MFNKMKHMSDGKKFAIFLFFAIFFAVVFVAFIAAVIWIVMTLWNTILTEVISGVKPVSFWQAAGLLLLSKILFSGFRGRSRSGSWKKKSRDKFKSKLQSKWMNMDPEKREEMKSRWKAHCEKRNASD